MTTVRDLRRRLVASLAVPLWGAAVALADLAHPRIRYGYVHRVSARLLRREMPTLGPVPGAAFRTSAAGSAAADPVLRCALVTDELDGGGIGRVVEMLCDGMRAFGVEPLVVVPVDGDRSASMRRRGIDVTIAPDPGTAGAALRREDVDVVQLHCAPRHLETAAMDSGHPLVAVLHNTEIHYDRAMWASRARLFSRCSAVVAVSDVVREYHRARLPRRLGDEIVVVPNGAPAPTRPTAEVRRRARESLASVVGSPLDEDVVVFSCLARYDSQKNITGTVVAFLDALASRAPARLVVAGDVSDWMELRRADAVRRAHPSGDRVHLLGRSDAAALLAASDAFVLDSFFEGWPLATTEAVAADLPIVVSDTGGARELVAGAALGSSLVANPTGPAARVTDGTARRARRRARRQDNRSELAHAIASLAGAAPAPGSRPADTSHAEMADRHAALLQQVVGTEAARHSAAGGEAR